MTAKNLINETVPPLKLTDDIAKALSWMSEFHVQHLPIINEKKEYIGLISEHDILDLNRGNISLSEYYTEKIARPCVYASQHIYEALNSINERRLSVIPVVDDEDLYVGSITMEKLMEYFASANSMQDPGGIIVLEMPIRDYTLTEIAQIVESGDAKILSMHVSTHPDGMTTDVTLKINRTELHSILATFERFEYKVKASYQEDDYIEDLKGRYDEFMNYLGI